VIVFALPGSSTETTSKQTIGPVEDLIVGLILWALAFVLRTGRDRPFRERRAEKTEAKRRAKEEAGKPTESLPLRLLGKGDPKVTFIVGVVLSFPGVSYLDSLDHIHRLNRDRRDGADGDLRLRHSACCSSSSRSSGTRSPRIGPDGP
jgi:hypothetical protein